MVGPVLLLLTALLIPFPSGADDTTRGDAAAAYSAVVEEEGSAPDERRLPKAGEKAEGQGSKGSAELPDHLPVPVRTFTIGSMSDIVELDRKLDDLHEETFGR